mmetsp:Transcript_12409/g.30495  ORF Transcript_12409/g.30495 Transcript_12409/m.30495 type:complete len:251 (+) Transcript_12409:27-779(+)
MLSSWVPLTKVCSTSTASLTMVALVWLATWALQRASQPAAGMAASCMPGRQWLQQVALGWSPSVQSMPPGPFWQWLRVALMAASTAPAPASLQSVMLGPAMHCFWMSDTAAFHSEIAAPMPSITPPHSLAHPLTTGLTPSMAPTHAIQQPSDMASALSRTHAVEFSQAAATPLIRASILAVPVASQAGRVGVGVMTGPGPAPLQIALPSCSLSLSILRLASSTGAKAADSLPAHSSTADVSSAAFLCRGT